jgi:pimeloyl-ACP methyl ester carboxylesterase
MQSGEVRALGALGGTGLARFGVLAKGMHQATAQRVFGALGPIGWPVRIMHDGISRVAYGTVSAGLGAVPRAIGAVGARTVPPGARRLTDSPGGTLALAALNGFYGDSLARKHGDLALELTVRRGGREVQTDSAGLAAAYPDATGKLAVFVHGLCETEHAWQLIQSRPSYGQQLRSELGYTPVDVRYNTGLHVSDNGRRLAEVLEHVVRGWPEPVEEVVLVGHSMGGLVARSACHYSEVAGGDWTRSVRHVFCLGTPHLGAPLERAANRAGWALSRLPETQPFADLVNLRSAGIKDLRYGSCIEEDWCDCDPDEYLRDRCKEVPFLDCARYYFVGATLSREPDTRFGRAIGDLLVQYVSASGNGPTRRIPFAAENGRHLGGTNHLQLLNHPAVYEQMRGWLEAA